MKIQVIVQTIALFTFSYTQCMKLTKQPNKIRPKILTLHNCLINQIIIEKKDEFKDPYFNNLNKRLALLQELTQQETKVTFINTEKNLEYWFIHHKNRFITTFYERLFIFLNYKTVVVTPRRSNFTDPKEQDLFITSLIFNNSLLRISYKLPIKDDVKKTLQQFLGIYRGDVAAKEVITTIAKINKESEINRLKHTQKNNQATLLLDQSFIDKFIQNQRKINKSKNDQYKYNKLGMHKLLYLQLLIDRKADVTYVNNSQEPLLIYKKQPTQLFCDQLHFLFNYNIYSDKDITINRVFFDQTTSTTTLQLDDLLLHISLKKAHPNTLKTLIKLLELHVETTHNQFLYIPEHKHPFTTENEPLKLPKEENVLFTSLSCNTQQFILDIAHDVT